MTQQVETSTINLKKLLSYNLHIPEYQRPYTWTAKNIIQLLDDVILFSKYPEYRIGTVILHKNGQQYDIVDGQQRMITSLLITRYLSLSTSNQEKLTALKIPTHEKTVRNVMTNLKIIEEYLDRHPHAKEILEDYFLEQCTVLVLTLEELDEAFQLFDSSNNRGKALYPTDLLKAYHLREVTGDERRKLEMVELWEAIPPEHIHTLFSDYFYRIKQWSRNKSVRDVGFTNHDINLFKGVSEMDNNTNNSWSKSILMAKNYVDNYNKQNQTMIEFKVMPSLDYPYQIDQPMINGEYFFKFVAYYHALTNHLGFLEGTNLDGDESAEITKLISHSGNENYFRYVNTLFKTTMLYVIDKFSQEEKKSIEKLSFKYAYYPRFNLQVVQKKSINKFVVDSDSNVMNFFHHIKESYSLSDVFHFEINAIEGELKNSEKVKRKSEELYSLYFKGGTK